MATIRQLLDKKGHAVLSVRPDETVYDAIKKMADKNVGSLVVMEGDSRRHLMDRTPLCTESVLERPRIAHHSRPRYHGAEHRLCAA